MSFRSSLASWGIMLGMPSMMGYAMPSSSLISSFVLASNLVMDKEDNSNTDLLYHTIFTVATLKDSSVYHRLSSGLVNTGVGHH